ncbi:unnamed protein product, partial [Ilex paraguariensis]
METGSSTKHGVGLDGGSAYEEASLGGAQGGFGMGDSPVIPSGGSRWGVGCSTGTLGTFGVISGVGKEFSSKPFRVTGGVWGVGELKGSAYEEASLGGAQGGFGMGDSPVIPSGGSRWGVGCSTGTLGTFGVISGVGKEFSSKPFRVTGGVWGVGELK